MSPEVSVIIPVYNAARYIAECIESLLRQTFQNFEIILINDGSTDNSGVICGKYAEADNRIHFVSQENRGVCVARNTGLEIANGEMITFVDADDLLPERGLELLYTEFKKTNADLIVADMSFLEGERLRRIRVFDKPFTTEDKIWINQYEMACIGYGYNPNPGTKMNVTGLGSMGNKLYKRKIIETNQVRFDPFTLGIYEDNLFVLHYLECCKCISYISESVYYYRRVKDSNSRGYKENILEINTRTFNKINEYIKAYKSDQVEEFNKALYIYIIRRLEVSLSAYFFSKENHIPLRKRFEKLKEIIGSEPYKSAIAKVDVNRLNPKNHRLTWITARTGSVLIIWFGFKVRKLARRMLIWN
jgi:glycosyltransferase involved in cell wall biosynthesis